MADKQHNESFEQLTDDDVLSGLDMLAGSIDSSVYPGQAWTETTERHSLRKFLIIGAGIAAAAAIVLLTVSVLFLSSGPQATVITATPQPPPVKPLTWSIPSGKKVPVTPSKKHRIDIALASKFVFEIPDIHIPSGSEAGRKSWSVPKFSFSTSLKRKKDNDKKKNIRSDSGNRPTGSDDYTITCNQPGSRSSRQT
ncbi:MAG: hypothetical protein GY794_13300 [bacterium]|nr:hypothetical protein [bacterium]